jgi:hypothetical protein
MTRCLCEGIADVERLELPKVAVARVQRTHAILEEDGRDVRVGDEIAARAKMPGCVAMRRYAIKVGHARQSTSGCAAHFSRKTRPASCRSLDRSEA